MGKGGDLRTAFILYRETMYIAYRAEWHERALEEQRRRAPHMLTKFAHNAVRVAGQMRGLIIEHHVSGWFRENYPERFLEPDNYRKWERVCSHDFKLNTPIGLLLIDVSGPKKDGSFGAYPFKPRCDVHFHILCRPLGFVRWDCCDYRQGFEVIGVLTSEHFQPVIFTQHIVPLKDWLNHIGL